ncbi:hypothetical protein PUN28_011511 [Cardiocondyla obscurior]|uniref:Uncharacterized protein n=1 Tax=Cardiocondyla obscurior TaxID=286306 RepID=A0AAW2FFL1_9HYME
MDAFGKHNRSVSSCVWWIVMGFDQSRIFVLHLNIDLTILLKHSYLILQVIGTKFNLNICIVA